jgi:hypothetical protein
VLKKRHRQRWHVEFKNWIFIGWIVFEFVFIRYDEELDTIKGVLELHPDLKNSTSQRIENLFDHTIGRFHQNESPLFRKQRKSLKLVLNCEILKAR